MSAALEVWRQRYEGLGLATVPVYPGSKKVIGSEWQSKPTGVQ